MNRTNWWKDHKKQIKKTASCVAAVCVAAGVWLTVDQYRSRRETEAILAERNAMREEAAQGPTGTGGSGTGQDGSGQNGSGDLNGGAKETLADGTTVLAGEAEDGADGTTEKNMDQNLEPILAENPVTYQGKTYRRNQYVKAILCMGVDRGDTMTESRKVGEAGQADGLFLIAQDTARHTLKILMIPRDTMTEMTALNRDGSVRGERIAQITLAFANGDGREASCENTVRSVEKLLSGFPVDSYLAADTSILATLNDAVGGVTVTVPTEGMEKRDPAFIKGSQITLHGAQAEAFVRYRDIEKDFSAIYRMNQQKEYITGFFRAVREKSKEDSQIVTKLFEGIQDYMVTDMGKETYLKIAMDALEGGGLDGDSFYTVPGYGETTDTFDLYHANREGALKLVLELFYREST